MEVGSRCWRALCAHLIKNSVRLLCCLQFSLWTNLLKCGEKPVTLAPLRSLKNKGKLHKLLNFMGVFAPSYH